MEQTLSTKELIARLKQEGVKVSPALVRDWTERGIISPVVRGRGIPARWAFDTVATVAGIKKARKDAPRRKPIEKSKSERWLLEGALPAGLSNRDVVATWFEREFGTVRPTSVLGRLLEALRNPSSLDDDPERFEASQSAVTALVERSTAPAHVAIIAELALRSAVTRGYNEGAPLPQIGMKNIFPHFDDDAFLADLGRCPLDVISNYREYIASLNDDTIERARLIVAVLHVACLEYLSAVEHISTSESGNRAVTTLTPYTVSARSGVSMAPEWSVLGFAVMSSRDPLFLASRFAMANEYARLALGLKRSLRVKASGKKREQARSVSRERAPRRGAENGRTAGSPIRS
jgi:hypothetical protein